MNNQEEPAQAAEISEQPEEQITTIFGNTKVVMSKDSIFLSVGHDGN